MSHDAIQQWLKKKITGQVTACWIGAVLALVAGVIVLFITFWLAYAALFIGELGISAVRELLFNHKFRLTHDWRLLICGLFVIALFVEWLRRSPDDLGNYGEINSPPNAQALVFQDGLAGAFTMILANQQASATMITELLYIGPRLVLGSVSLIRNASRWKKINLQNCAWVLQVLMERPGAVTNEEFSAALAGQDWDSLKNEAAQIPGVVFLEKGLTLSEDFRREIAEQLVIH